MTCQECGGHLYALGQSLRPKKFCSRTCEQRATQRRRYQRRKLDQAWQASKREYARLWRVREVAAGRLTPGGRPCS